MAASREITAVHRGACAWRLRLLLDPLTPPDANRRAVVPAAVAASDAHCQATSRGLEAGNKLTLAAEQCSAARTRLGVGLNVVIRGCLVPVSGSALSRKCSGGHTGLIRAIPTIPTAMEDTTSSCTEFNCDEQAPPTLLVTHCCESPRQGF